MINGGIMKRSYFLFITGICILTLAGADLFAKSYKKVDSAKTANMIFASSAIGKGKESSVTLKDSFTSSESIYARCYFPKAIGRFDKGEKCHLHLWVDGKVIWRGVYSGRTLPDASWDQIQIYIRNTGENDFNGAISNALDTVSSGSHEVQFIILRDKFMKYKYIKDGKSVTKEPVYKPVYLSKGKFNYEVK